MQVSDFQSIYHIDEINGGHLVRMIAASFFHSGANIFLFEISTSFGGGAETVNLLCSL